MPQAVPLAISIGTVIAAKGAEGWALAGILAAGTAMSAGASSLISRASSKSSTLTSAEGVMVNSCTTLSRRRVVYGTRKVGGNIVFYGKPDSGDDGELWVVLSLGEGPCEGIAQVDEVDQLWLGNELWDTYGDGNVEYWFHSGTADQTVDTNLQAAIAEWTDTRPYDCYLVLKLTWDSAYFQGLPTITCLLKGRLLYDFRTETTAYSSNPVLERYDYLTNTLYGRKVAASAIDITSYTSAANYCDTKGYESHFVLDGEPSSLEVLDALDILYRGDPQFWAGVHYLHYADLNDETSVMDLTDDHVVCDAIGKQSLTIGQPSGRTIPDGLRMHYIEPDKGYVGDTVLVGETSGLIKDVQLAACCDRTDAALTGTYLLERMKLDRTISGTFRGDALQLERRDVTTATFAKLGIASQTMRVSNAGLISSGYIPLTLEFEALNLYNGTYDSDPDDTYTCSLPDRTAVPPGVENVSVSEVINAYRGTSFITLQIAFDLPSGYPAGWISHVAVYRSLNNVDWEYLYPVHESFDIENVLEGQTYYIRLKVVSKHGPAQADNDDYKISHLITGVSATTPPSVAALEAIKIGSTVHLYAVKLSADDVDVYEFRLGTTWTGALYLASNESPNYPMAGVKPGSHTFLINTLGKNGLYGATPCSATVTLTDPPDNWTVATGLTTTLDYTTGTHDNTEHTTYSTEDHLMCSHTAGELEGTWKSAVIDLGSSARRLVYALADVVVTGAGTTLDDIFPAGSTLEEIGLDRTLSEILALDAAPSVQISLNYGEDTSVTSSVSRLEILCAEIDGRYAQIEVTITDPSAAVYAMVEEMTLKFCTPA